MYLLKLPSSVYYHRSPVPASLRERGFPNEVRLSLLTKDRNVALERNIYLSLAVKQSFENALSDDSLSYTDIKETLYQKLSELRHGYVADTSKVSHSNVITTTPKRKGFDARHALGQFLRAKESDNVTALTLHQLEQRATHCLDFLEGSSKPFNEGALEAYIEHLKAEGRSAKTNKDYFAVVKQFFTWCHSKRLMKVNPCLNLSPKFKSDKHASEQRDVWKACELDMLFKSAEYQNKSADFRYITELQAYHGLRPNEACQLFVGDVQTEDNLWYINITDVGDQQHLKNEHSVRQIPIHPDVVHSGFIDFVQTKAAQHSPTTPLFDYKPYGHDYDWSKYYRVEFGKLQTKIGMEPGARPTPYGFRHTFIDELKNAELAEALVSEYVGHANQSMTFGRYGKKLKLKKLLKVAHTFKLPTDIKEA
ncbi:site-specific integrase [Vibrio parahaemolyticus]|uniref:Tyrosine-type recombinase/integrase n=1 Tax=Vibrio parahaemolyticus TaxID=670 RepID=A0A7Y0XE56_VIBPH|nr:site-specific integrase [Vibrio parahaemolyticus]EJB8584481.1 tyrosine-type recombinase/integrase [Vibrio parahaemolyticus]EJG0713896.1 tyrosine-type recombinase/integrase [Vibrio parahaemolyticus]MDF4555194.1 site-specific integrase [Vibrio parahaemolyticus]MDF5015406.1 site-specific integrase [Vibrio parahaemolyticus]MDF5094602.1 site-specific integrase [Vibrio parahaemolyticus]